MLSETLKITPSIHKLLLTNTKFRFSRIPIREFIEHLLNELNSFSLGMTQVKMQLDVQIYRFLKRPGSFQRRTFCTSSLDKDCVWTPLTTKRLQTFQRGTTIHPIFIFHPVIMSSDIGTTKGTVKDRDRKGRTVFPSCLLYTSQSPRDSWPSRIPSSAW